ncbi:Na+/H+ antiporter NhaA [Azospirillum canadense]|uniref:Na+/H+ antiporter NhaA n=1 Tax=Azospirillum canadense TaxID=403962 RepID=UPI0022271F2E|nr:Na+/H+ antiporter NhaA [Azospirillum canadense]MCW2241841.1 NhaA family Na+:H+ antiporter [Azospirillum canadense]
MRPLSLLRDFLDSEASGGLLLMAAAALALVVANSPLAPLYFSALHAPVAGLAVLHWINDGLMAMFFLLVGLEIKREMLDGQLASWPRRALPGLAAAGGMLAPAVIYAAVNASDPVGLRGWAIPAATDIAFALGIISLIGPRVPASLKVFLAALAILDDLGAVVIIALFYTADLSLGALGLAGAALLVLVALNRFGVTRLWPYLTVGGALWACVLASGVHATLAGVALALTVPLYPTPGRHDELTSPLHRLEHAINPWVAFGIVPIFGFANAGVSFTGLDPSALVGPVPLGIALGLFVGKQCGVFAASWLAIRSGLADLPAGASWLQLYGVALLCGIGFTMSLFIGALAFPTAPELADAVKVGVLGGSLLSALAGWLVLRRAPREALSAAKTA